MSTNTTIVSKPTQSSITMLRAMVGIGIACALLIVITYEGTKQRIDDLKKEALEEAIFKVMPGISSTQAYTINDNQHFIKTNDDKLEQLVYAGYDDNGNLVGVAVTGSGIGYADVIRILYGYNFNSQTVVGFYVLESKETPGLGDKIEKDESFLTNFNALDVSLTDDKKQIKNPVLMVKSGAKANPWEIDGISGATISSRTIGEIMKNSTSDWIPLIYRNKNDFIMKKE